MKTKNFLPSTDLSEYLTTQKLMEAWYLLASKDLAVLVDAVKPKLTRLFAYGKFGSLQQLLYDPDGRENDRGLYGIVPAYRVGEKRYFPFIHKDHDFTDNTARRVEFNPGRNRLRMEGIQCFDEKAVPGGMMNLETVVQGSKIILNLEYPPEAERSELVFTLYPLYSEYQGPVDRTFMPVEYFNYGYRACYFPNFDRVVGKSLTLKDCHGRMPMMRIRSERGTCRLISRTDPERGNAFQLRVVVEVAGGKDRMDIDLRPNPITIHCRPYYFAGSREQITITAKTKPVVRLDGRPVPVSAGKSGVYTFYIIPAPGKHTLSAQTRMDRSDREFCVVGDPEPYLKRMADVAVQLPWKKGPIRNLMPYFYYLDTLEPAGRGETADNACAFGSHSLRAFCILADGAILTDIKAFLEWAMRSLNAVVKKSHRFDDGDLVFTHEIDLAGRPYLTDSTRPSDLALMVRALLYTHHGYQHFGDGKNARKCLDLAVRYAHTLTKMQQPDGSFFPRYHYPTLEPNASEPMGTVNNWAMQIWELANLYEPIDAGMARELKTLCIRHIDFLLAKIPSQLRLAGGGEDPPNFMDALSSTSLFMLIKFLHTGEPKYKNYAQQAFLMGALTTTIFADQPNNYFCAHSPWLPVFYNQPALPNKGGMHDLTMIEAGWYLKRYLDFDFGRDVASYNFADRLIDGVLPNGGLYGLTVQAPNYYYRREDGAETLDFGSVGIYGYFHITAMK